MAPHSATSTPFRHSLPMLLLLTVSKWICAHTRALLVLFLSLLISLLSLHSYFSNQPDCSGCQMSYMRPFFIHQSEFQSWTRFGSKYNLYLYRERGYLDTLNGSDRHASSVQSRRRVPVLFVPGHCGSHRQVRSIASTVTQMHAELISDGSGDSLVDFDFFAIALNEEFTALHGHSLLEQAEYVNEAIRYILSLYDDDDVSSGGDNTTTTTATTTTDSRRPRSVMVIGHSMGGMVARTAFMLPKHLDGSVDTIITLSTPHNFPPVALEQHIYDMYHEVNAFWRHGMALNNSHRAPDLRDIALVSVVGGNLDGMINSDFAYIGHVVPEPINGMTVFTTGIPDVWLSANHHSILWCRQLVRRLSRAIIELGYLGKTDVKHRMQVFRRYFGSGFEVEAALGSPVAAIPGQRAKSSVRAIDLDKTGPIIRSRHAAKRYLAVSGHDFAKLGLDSALVLLDVDYDRYHRDSDKRCIQIMYDPEISGGISQDDHESPHHSQQQVRPVACITTTTTGIGNGNGTRQCIEIPPDLTSVHASVPIFKSTSQQYLTFHKLRYAQFPVDPVIALLHASFDKISDTPSLSSSPSYGKSDTDNDEDRIRHQHHHYYSFGVLVTTPAGNGGGSHRDSSLMLSQHEFIHIQETSADLVINEKNPPTLWDLIFGGQETTTIWYRPDANDNDDNNKHRRYYYNSRATRATSSSTSASVRDQTEDIGPLRVRVKIDIDENPVIAIRAKLMPRRRNRLSSGTPLKNEGKQETEEEEKGKVETTSPPRWPVIVRQSDNRGRGNFESKFWSDQTEFVVAFHGRGAYTQLAEGGAADWDGLYLDVWMDPLVYDGGFDLELRIDWYSSLNRLVKRYDMAAACLPFVWTVVVVLGKQFGAWWRGSGKGLGRGSVEEEEKDDGEEGSGGDLGHTHNLWVSEKGAHRYMSFGEGLEAVARGRSFWLMLLIAALVPVMQSIMVGISGRRAAGGVSDETAMTEESRQWQALYMGYRSSSTAFTSAISVMLMALMFGFVVAINVTLVVVVWVLSRVVALVEGVLGGGSGAASVVGKPGESKRWKEVFTRKRLAMLGVYIVAVWAVVPYHFGFIVVACAQMLRIARGYAELRLLEAEVKEAGDGKGAKQAQKRRGERERRRWHRKVEQERQKRADQVNYQTSILMLWFCNIPFCAPELMVWMKNLSVSWHHDNASDHYATKVVGFYLLYMICSNEMLPRLTWERARKGGEWYGVARVWGNAVQYGRLIVGAWLVGFALIYGMRQPYLLHGAIHWISLWLIVIHVGHKLVVCSS